MGWRIILGKLHMLLGLSSGLVIGIVALSGACLIFEHDIHSLTEQEVDGKIQLQPSEILAAAVDSNPGKRVNSIEIFTEKNALVHFQAAHNSAYNEVVLVDPFTGDINGMRHVQGSFFRVAQDLHTNLLLGKAGKQIIRWSSLIFLIQIISGIVLWWPRGSGRFNLKFKINRHVPLGKNVHNLHSVAGFYASWILILTVVVGVVWSFEWMERSLYFTASGGESKISLPSPVSSFMDKDRCAHFSCVDFMYSDAQNRCGFDPLSSAIFFPDEKNDPVFVVMNPSTSRRIDYYGGWYNRYTGDFIMEENLDEMNSGDYLERMYFDIHTGNIWGIPGKVLLFFACFVAASLPVTGFLMWRKRR